MALSYFFRLLGGRPKADVQIEPDNIPSTDQKGALGGTSGTPSSSNKFVTNDDSRNSDARTPVSHDNTYHSATYITASSVTYENLNSNSDVGQGSSQVAAGDDSRFPTSDEKAALGAAPNALSTSNPVADKQYVDTLVQGIDWQDSVQYAVEYVKSTSGAPSGTATNGETCLNTNEKKLYTYTTSWDSGVAVTSGQRFIHKDTGSDTSGDSGTYTASKKIYDYNGTSFDEITPTEGAAVWCEDEDSLFTYNGSAWVIFGSITQHNNLSGLQGGTSAQYYHITSDQEAGLDAATAISSTNPPLTKADRDMIPVAYKFAYKGGFPVSQTDVEAYESAGSFQRILMPSAGSIVKSTLQSTSARSAGTFTAEPTIDGTKAAANDLDLTLNGTTTNDAKAEVAPGTTNLTFTAGQKIGAKFTSDADWAPIDSDLEYTIYVVFNS